MTLKNFLQSLKRRWYLVLGGLLLTACLCGVVFQLTPPGYQRSASILLIPGTSSIPPGGNPYLYLGGLGQASDVIVRALRADAAADPVLGDFADASISIDRDATTSGPLVTMTVEARSHDDAAAVHERLLELMPVTLTTLQSLANVPQEARISSLPLTVDEESLVSQRNRIESTGAAAAAGLALTVLLVGLMDGLLLAQSGGLPLPGGVRESMDSGRNRKNRARRAALPPRSAAASPSDINSSSWREE